MSAFQRFSIGTVPTLVAVVVLLLGCASHPSGAVEPHHAAPQADAGCLQVCLAREAGNIEPIVEQTTLAHPAAFVIAGASPMVEPKRLNGSVRVPPPSRHPGSLKRYQLIRSYRI